MNTSVDKRLLYYVGVGVVPKKHFGYDIYRFKFIDLDTAKSVVYAVCYGHIEELAHVLKERCYDSIEKMTEENTILWDISNNKIKQIRTPYEEVEGEYKRLKNEGVRPIAIANYMVEIYCSHEKIK